MKQIKQETANEIFFIVAIGLIALSVIVGYWKIMVLHDFTIFTTEEEIESYVPLPETLDY